MMIGVMTTLVQRNVSLWNVSEGRAGLRNYSCDTRTFRRMTQLPNDLMSVLSQSRPGKQQQ
jgi:hypothetical protein